ncbi:tetrathionate reductase subunit TtrC [Trabulsiella odontotermitis]|uniref:tetrathionate reductase subunit TtrC n=1 Tax=Trabulsiella odontotermitis TaxID=379893 RepID=UPI000676570F|nr:tetrathionate reductase subunit TtrC [Trabulsiella odontotermitis]KNC89754.1 tetrathionate reductase subunit C [Trabulsiella odontotermitis]
MNITEILVQPQEITWQPWAVQYFFFIGISACAALVACVARWTKHSCSDVLERTCLFIALTCGITAPLALLADLHQPARVWHFYAWPTPWSWMPWGALLLPLFTTLLGLWFVFFHLCKKTLRYAPLMPWFSHAAALTAVGLFIYTGREVSVVRAHPVWFSYWLPVVMFLSAMCALFAILHFVFRKHNGYSRLLAKGQVVILVLFGVATLTWYLGDTLSGDALRQQWHLTTVIHRYTLAGVVLWGIAFIVALYASGNILPPAIQLADVLIVAGLCWLLRWTVLIGGQTIPKYNALTNVYTLPAGTDGLLAIIGTFGLWFALIIIISEAINWFSGRFQHA